MIDTAALREKVLDLAIRGKLVPQDPNDEPASVLLERIRLQKQQMVKEGKLKAKDIKDDSVIFVGEDNLHYEKFADGTVKCIEDEIPFELPNGWSWCRLGVLYAHNTGKALNSSDTVGTKLTYITTSNLYWDRFELENLKEMPFTESEIEKCTVRKGDLLVCEGGDIGRSAIWMLDEEIRIQNHIHRLRPYIPLINRFYYYVLYLWKQTKRIGGQGIGLQGFSSKALHKLIVPLVPLNEQNKIVDKIDSIICSVDALEQLKEEFQDTIDNIKSKILDLAIRGKLVPQDPNDEPASILLERIRAEKEELIKQGKIKRDKKESVIFKGADNSYYEKVGDVVNCIDADLPFDIPINWKWCRLGDLVCMINGVSYDKKDIGDSGIRIIRGGNIDNHKIQLLQDDVFLPYNYFDDEKQIKNGDIVVVASTGSKIAIGRAGFANENIPNTQIGAFLRIVRPINNHLSRYIQLIFASDYYRNSIRELVHGNTINNIKNEYISDLLVPIPPFKEQIEICNYCAELFTIIQKIEKSLG